MGCTPETARGLFGSTLLTTRLSLCMTCVAAVAHRSGLDSLTTPSMRSGIPLATSPLEFGIPESSTPRHLPSMCFLSTSTAYSSSRFARLFSYGRHLWDSKSLDELTSHCSASGRSPLRRAVFASDVYETHPQERNARRCFQPEYLASRLLLPMPRRVSLRVFDRPYIPSA